MPGRRGRSGPATFLLGVAALASGCELQEVTVVDFVDVAVAEVFVTLRDAPGVSSVRAFLHGTTAGGVPEARTFDGALVRVTRTDGLVLDLAVAPLDECVASSPEEATGTCFVGDSAAVAQLRPGDALDLEITLGSGGGRAVAALTLPGSFQLAALGDECRLPADTTLEIRWSRSAGSWAYLNETMIEGLAAALASEGIEADDPLYLLGLSISAADTTIVFPSEFGVFDRFDLEPELSVRLQRGLPDLTRASVSIAAVDRNYVNWARGGNFNPSGQVRVSSLRGAASGVFGGAVVKEFVLHSSTSAITGVPDCP